MSLRLEDLPLSLQEQARSKLNSERKSKYGAHKTVVDGINFDSKKESERYANLALLARAGVISDLELQPVFLLQDSFIYDGHKERKIEYKADFRYNRDGIIIIEDVKGVRTKEYRIKRKLFLYRYKEHFDNGSWIFKEL